MTNIFVLPFLNGREATLKYFRTLIQIEERNLSQFETKNVLSSQDWQCHLHLKGRVTEIT